MVGGYNASQEEIYVEGDMEYGTFHSVSEGGSTIYGYNSLPSIVIENAKKYIIENRYDGENIKFYFCNSPYTYSPEYVMENILDCYNQDLAIIESDVDSYGNVYYVEQVYEIDNEGAKSGGGVGYFAINKDGIIVESNSLKTADELSRYPTEPGMGTEGITRARELLGLDGSVDLHVGGNYAFFYEDSEGVELCYKYRFADGSEIYINGVTGEKIK